jgi:cellulose synthase/poly-beta-1,6-N-acetylglucosamine synthase-like glycosyltransferase
MDATARSEVFFVVLARTKDGVEEKIAELENLGVPYIIVCGEKTNCPNVVYRPKKGKFDAINFGAKYLRPETKIVCLNDVDTRIYNFEKSLSKISKELVLVFCKVRLDSGPQVHFYSLLDRIRRSLPINSSGELMLVERSVFERILPIPPCKTEDNYISFRVLELGYKLFFCEECWVETKRTQTLEEEERYKTRTVTGLYQALSLTEPPASVRVFYLVLPFLTPLLLLQGRRGLAWAKGILHGLANFLQGDRGGKF